MWQADYVRAHEEATRVLDQLTDPGLRGYRALWHYLAGSAAFLASADGRRSMGSAARHQFEMAKKATAALPWLVRLSQYSETGARKSNDDQDLSGQVERMESNLLQLGASYDRRFEKVEMEILRGLRSPATFEAAQKKLGWLLGFEVGKIEGDGTPDPWWISAGFCLVFEDHAGAKVEGVLGANKARQAAGHPRWIEENVPGAGRLRILPVLVSPVTKANDGALPHLKSVYLWPLREFNEWARKAIAIVRQLRSSLSEPSVDWRMYAVEILRENSLSMAQICEVLAKNVASDRLTVGK